jgi:RNA polymerase sigma-70 factor (ECF subfamily)
VGPTSKTSEEIALADPDTRLMIRVRDEEPAAFSELVAKYQHRLVAVLCHLVGDQGEAEDLAQEVFLRIFRARKKYRARAKFSTWLFTIANNLALNALRNKQRKPVVPLKVHDSGPLGPRPQEHLIADTGERPSQEMQKQELAAIVRKALEGLNERQRAAVLLNKFEEMNYAEIAQVMRLSTKAVKSLLNRARAKLREALADYICMDGAPPPMPDDEE